MMKRKFSNEENILTCMFSGRLDTLVCSGLINELGETIEEFIKEPYLQSVKIAFDLKDVSYISSAFIRICMNTSKQLVKGNFSIVNCDPFVKKTFKIAGLDDVLNIK